MSAGRKQTLEDVTITEVLGEGSPYMAKRYAGAKVGVLIALAEELETEGCLNITSTDNISSHLRALARILNAGVHARDGLDPDVAALIESSLHLLAARLSVQPEAVHAKRYEVTS